MIDVGKCEIVNDRETVIPAVRDPMDPDPAYDSLYVDWAKSAPSWGAIMLGGIFPVIAALIVIFAIILFGLQFLSNLIAP